LFQVSVRREAVHILKKANLSKAAQTRFRERAMPLFDGQQQHGRGIRWFATAATVAAKLLVLLALAFAIVRYVEWSSDAAQAEFMRSTKSPVSDLNHSGEFSSSIQLLKGRTACPRKG
jgi:hypothetical protein